MPFVGVYGNDLSLKRFWIIKVKKFWLAVYKSFTVFGTVLQFPAGERKNKKGVKNEYMHLKKRTSGLCAMWKYLEPQCKGSTSN